MSAGSAAVLDTYRRHLSGGRAKLAEMFGGQVEVASSGAYVTDSDGRQYLDCGGYGVFFLGHTHPAVVGAVVEQVRRHPLATRLLLEPTAATAAQTLTSTTPAGLERVYFATTGAEAVETAIKLARAQGKSRLVSATGGFHGKTMGALSLTARAVYQEPFRPLLPDVTHVRYGDAGALDAVLAGMDGMGCVFLEPVQGEGGVVVPPPGYLREVARSCREHGALLVADEVQTGLGRLGRWWGVEAEDVVPDMLLVGKGLSGGVVPVSAVVATEDVFVPFDRDPFVHSSVFAASPIAMAAATAAVRAIGDEGLVERAAKLGEALLGALRQVVAGHCGHLVTEVRGAGLLIGLEMRDEHVAGELILELLDRGVVVNHSLNAHRVVRVTPPAILTDSDTDLLLTRFTDAASALASRH